MGFSNKKTTIFRYPHSWKPPHVGFVSMSYASFLTIFLVFIHFSCTMTSHDKTHGSHRHPFMDGFSSFLWDMACPAFCSPRFRAKKTRSKDGSPVFVGSMLEKRDLWKAESSRTWAKDNSKILGFRAPNIGQMSGSIMKMTSFRIFHW